jgi:hypothetical protein
VAVAGIGLPVKRQRHAGAACGSRGESTLLQESYRFRAKRTAPWNSKIFRLACSQKV